jgi:type II secretory ATPase GspE/PulE/Tfp pilus assembly ATPase PilB-like protein
MGVEPYLVSSSLEVVAAQRLVRIICPACRRPAPAEEVAKLRMQFGEIVPDVLYQGGGCRRCQNTGYRGRQGVFELMVISDEIRSLVLQRAPSYELRKVATRQGMSSLRDDGWRVIREGRTTVDEVLRNTKDEDAIAGFTDALDERRQA